MPKDVLTDNWTMKDKKVVRIARKKVEQAIIPHIETFAAHLDLEGFAYIKIIRTGPHECFAQDVTSRILKGDEPQGNRNMTTAEISDTFWKEPAMVKWAKHPPKEKP
jgi:hypothetical protein